MAASDRVGILRGDFDFQGLMDAIEYESAGTSKKKAKVIPFNSSIAFDLAERFGYRAPFILVNFNEEGALDFSCSLNPHLLEIMLRDHREDITAKARELNPENVPGMRILNALSLANEYGYASDAEGDKSYAGVEWYIRAARELPVPYPLIMELCHVFLLLDVDERETDFIKKTTEEFNSFEDYVYCKQEQERSIEKESDVSIQATTTLSE